MKLKVKPTFFTCWFDASSTIIGYRIPRITGRRIGKLIVKRSRVVHWVFWVVVEVPMIVIFGSIFLFAALFTLIVLKKRQ